MNLNQLWAGNDYAYYSFRGRGETFRLDAQRVRIIRAFQKRESGNERLSGYAEVQFLTNDGDPAKNYNDKPIIKEVRARDIAMRWDEYVDEREHRELERDKLQREAIERDNRENRAKAAIMDAVEEKLGIPRNSVTSISPYGVVINRRDLERILGLEHISV